jgi:hypothetical protein
MKLSGWTKSEQEQGVGGRLLICCHKKIPNNGYCSELAGEYWRIKIFLMWIKLWMVRWPRSKKWRRSSANVEQSEVKWAQLWKPHRALFARMWLGVFETAVFAGSNRRHSVPAHFTGDCATLARQERTFLLGPP